LISRGFLVWFFDILSRMMALVAANKKTESHSGLQTCVLAVLPVPTDASSPILYLRSWC
jgi:hypothetical protein